jgi:hypothetical protein
MKLKDGYMLREVAGNSVVVAVGKAAVDFNGLICLNSSGTLLWKLLADGANAENMLAAILNEYEIDETSARNDINAFINKLKGADLLE